MAEVASPSPGPSTATGLPGLQPAIRLEWRHAVGRSVSYDVAEGGFLVGSVVGCDLRLPGVDLPPLVCLITPRPGGAGLRKLAPTQVVLVNGRAASSALLATGDRLTLGQGELLVHIQQATQAETTSAPVRGETPAPELVKPETGQPGRIPGSLEIKTQDLARQRQELEAIRQELIGVRQQLYDNYSQRRDRLAGMKEAVSNAARKVQERKQQVDEEVRQASAARAELDARAEELERKGKELDARANELARQCQDLDELHAQVDKRREAVEQEAADRLDQCQNREEKLTKDRQLLEKNQAQYQEDLVRLDRLQGVLEKRQEQLRLRALEVDRRQEQIHRDCRDMEEQGVQLEEWHQKLAAEAARIERDNADLDRRRAEVVKGTVSLEEQQTALAALRTRLEHQRDEQQREGQRLTEQRSRQEDREAEIRNQLLEMQQIQEECERQQEAFERDRAALDERSASVEKAGEQLRRLKELLDAQEAQLRAEAQDLKAEAARQAAEAVDLKQRSEQFAILQERLGTDRLVLREREAELVKKEQAREALQDQLRRRAEELTEKQKTLAEQARLHAEGMAALELRRAEIEEERRRDKDLLAEQRRAVEVRGVDLDHRLVDVADREKELELHVERLKESGRKIAAARKALSEEQAQWQGKRQETEEALARKHQEMEELREQTQGLQDQLPELEQRVRTAGENLAEFREQLHQHLAELHAYARQSQEELESLRTRVQAEAEGVRQQSQGLQRSRDEHRLAAAAFRQQLIEWQSQVAGLKKTLAQDETRLERRQAQVEADSARLARQAEHLQVQEREVAQQRDEMDRHLTDMREWYRRKLRELSERHQAENEADRRHPAGTVAGAEPGAERSRSGGPDILTLTGDVDPADGQLGDLLRSLELIEPETLMALLVEARKQRRSLRQILLASGCVTLYQMALIEAGNVDGLMLGPVRVVDRLRVTPRETVYRVFDPRGGQDTPGTPATYAVLRHLAEAEMNDPSRPADFHRRFLAAATVRHPHLAATLEVLDIAGRPAVLQEWITGLPSSEWGPLAAVPGVWFRLLCQVALGLHTAHQGGLVHGHLDSASILLTPQGQVKVSGFGEPPWLHGMTGAEPPQDDLVALGQLAATWAAPALARRKGKAKTLPGPMEEILTRLGTEAGKQHFTSAAVLLTELERLGESLTPNPEAWDRMIHHVRSQGLEESGNRQSA